MIFIVVARGRVSCRFFVAQTFQVLANVLGVEKRKDKVTVLYCSCIFLNPMFIHDQCILPQMLEIIVHLIMGAK